MILRSFDATTSHDLDASLVLFERVYGRAMSPAFYRWRFVENPFGPPMISLLWEGDVLAGHYAVSPARSLIDTGPCLAGQSMTTMTHPSYRNQGVFTRLATHLYDAMMGLGAALVWGLPNPQSHYGFTQKLHWRDVGIIATMTWACKAIVHDTPIDDTAHIGPWTTELFARSVDGRIYPSVKDEQYLKWRYVDHPEQHYTVFALPQSHDVLIVAKDYSTPQGLALELVDYLFEDRQAFGVALRGVLAWASHRNYAMVRTWMAVSDRAFPDLEKLGFLAREPLTYFGGRALAHPSVLDDAWSPHRWCITMGNSDNY